MDVLDWLPTLFDRKNEHGEYAYSDEEMCDFLAAMMLAIGFERHELTPEIERLLAKLARKAGVDPEAPREETQRVLEGYFASHPLNPELVSAFKLGFREALVRVSAGELAKTITKYAAAGERKLFEPRAAPKEGAVRGGPLGFFLARKKLDGGGEE